MSGRMRDGIRRRSRGMLAASSSRPPWRMGTVAPSLRSQPEEALSMSGTQALPPSLTGRFPLVRLMARGWWVFILRGVVAILFGIVAFLAPGMGLAFILGILAAWMAIDGVSTLYQAVKGPPERHGVWFWVDGIIS